MMVLSQENGLDRTHERRTLTGEKRSEISVNTKCLQAEKQGAEGCYRKPVVLLLPSSSSFIFLLMFPSLLVSLPLFHLSILLRCVCSCVHARLCVSLRVGVGDKTDSQHHCVYKASVCCRLWAYHSSAQRLRTISHACARACVHVCTCEREGGSERERD